jgi:hypothetical protein
MEIKYSAHAVEKMIQRSISPQEVEMIIADPLGKIQQSKDKYIYYKKIKGRKDNLLAAVTVLRNKDVFEVITVMINFEVNE